jgi:SpoVK/Ycf46/Vps4 family AAA+-type ATPase
MGISNSKRVVAGLVVAKAVWEDLALPEGVAAALRRLADEAGRSRGVRALFVGENGSAKLKAAEAIAHHLGRNLFVVDLDAIVSKHVGETEKQIGKVFDAADASGAVLFLDEADALFGKRTGVKDSHDRYAAIVVRRLKSFNGMAIVAGKKKSGLDSDFPSALRSVVTFPLSDADQSHLLRRR